MSKQILNIVFPPPSALFKNPCGFLRKGEKSSGFLRGEAEPGLRVLKAKALFRKIKIFVAIAIL